MIKTLVISLVLPIISSIVVKFLDYFVFKPFIHKKEHKLSKKSDKKKGKSKRRNQSSSSPLPSNEMFQSTTIATNKQYVYRFSLFLLYLVFLVISLVYFSSIKDIFSSTDSLFTDADETAPLLSVSFLKFIFKAFYIIYLMAVFYFIFKFLKPIVSKFNVSKRRRKK